MHCTRPRGAAVAAIALLVATTAAADPAPGFTAAAGAGVNRTTPFVEAQLGRRFAHAPHVELYVDYSYDRPISTFSFQTFGVGVRSDVARVGPIALYHQALAGFALSSGGRGPVQDRDLGQRVLGPIFTQGVGGAYSFAPCWSVALTISTGYPVWFRPELDLRVRF